MMKRIYQIILFALLVLGSTYAHGQQNDVLWGVVTDKLTKEPLIGVNVLEVDENNRVVSYDVTNINGEFVLPIKNRKDKISFSFIGYKSHTIEIGEKMVYNIDLSEDTQEIETVNVTAEARHNDGTFSIPQREISTAVQTISTKEFEGMQVTSIDEALQGRIAGLDIVSASGDPGSGTTMRIRGASTLGNGVNSAPLIVVNGIPWSMDTDPDFDYANSNQEQYANMLSLNPDDIESITVLKDAASTSVWGSKGANGVLMINTKSGSRGPTRFSYSLRQTIAKQPRGLKLLNGDEYTMMMKQAMFNPLQDEIASNIPQYKYDENYVDYENYNNNTDWVKEVTQIGFIQDHYLTASGGGKRANFRVSGGILNQDGTVIGQKYQRISSMANLEYNVSDKLKFITEFSYTYGKNDRSYENLLGIAYTKMPNVSVYDQDRDGNDTDVFYNIPLDSRLTKAQRELKNPVALAKLAKNTLISYRVTPVFRIRYQMLKSLRYNGYVSFDMSNQIVNKFLPIEASNTAYDGGAANSAFYSDDKSLSLRTDHNLTWSPKFSNEDHSFTLYGALIASTGYVNPLSISAFAIPHHDLKNAANEAITSDLKSIPGRFRSMAMLTRGHYAYKSRYIFGFSVRRDGSTKFGNDYKFGNFPGLSAKWILSDEDFMISTNYWLSMLSLRGSWGVSGGQPQQEYLHYARYSSNGNYASNPVVEPTSLAISGLKWQTQTSYNIGTDIGLFDDKLIFDINMYNSLTEDLLLRDIRIPSTSGYGSVNYRNAGAIENVGWEFNMNANKLIKVSDWYFDFSLNFANNRNLLRDLDEDILAGYNDEEFSYKNGDYLTRLQVDNPYGSIYGFVSEGVYKYDKYYEGMEDVYEAPVAKDANGNVVVDSRGEPIPMLYAYGRNEEYQFRGGDARYWDRNSDGSIDELDIVYLGNSNPKLTGGFGTVIRHKSNLSISAFFNFRIGNSNVNDARMNLENMYDDGNQSVAVNYRWRKNGDDTPIPRALYHYGYNWLGSSRYVEDGSFLRFKYLTFRYSMPKKTLEKIGVTQMKFYLTINNIAVMTRYTGVDPEVGYEDFGVSKDNSKTPRTKDAVLGISLTF